MPSSLVEIPRAMAAPKPWRRLGPFVLSALAALFALRLVPFTDRNEVELALLSTGAIVLTAALLPWRSLPRWSELGVPLAFMAMVTALRESDPESALRYSPLYVLAVAWCALYGTKRELLASGVALVTCLVLPGVLRGFRPDEAAQAMVALVLWPLVAFAVQHAVAVAATANAMLSTTLDQLDMGVVLLGERREVLVSNRAYSRLFGVPDAMVAALDLDTFLAFVAPNAAHPDEFEQRMRALAAAPGTSSETFELARPERRVLVRTETPIAGHEAVVVTWRDITPDADRAAESERHAMLDPLTGALNRRGGDAAFERELARARRERTPLAIAVFDADHFKRVNDEHGHTVGDEVLQRLARTLLQQARARDVVIRWGGEEFVALLPGVDGAGAKIFAERARAAVSRLEMPGVGRVTLSAGVTAVHHDELPVQAMTRADRNLYAAKRQGRDRVVTDEDVAESL